MPEGPEASAAWAVLAEKPAMPTAAADARAADPVKKLRLDTVLMQSPLSQCGFCNMRSRLAREPATRVGQPGFLRVRTAG